jgi:hypothetical protein
LEKQLANIHTLFHNAGLWGAVHQEIVAWLRGLSDNELDRVLDLKNPVVGVQVDGDRLTGVALPDGVALFIDLDAAIGMHGALEEPAMRVRQPTVGIDLVRHAGQNR